MFALTQFSRNYSSSALAFVLPSANTRLSSVSDESFQSDLIQFKVYLQPLSGSSTTTNKRKKRTTESQSSGVKIYYGSCNKHFGWRRILRFGNSWVEKFCTKKTFQDCSIKKIPNRGVEREWQKHIFGNKGDEHGWKNLKWMKRVQNGILTTFRLLTILTLNIKWAIKKTTKLWNLRRSTARAAINNFTRISQDFRLVNHAKLQQSREARNVNLDESLLRRFSSCLTSSRAQSVPATTMLAYFCHNSDEDSKSILTCLIVC